MAYFRNETVNLLNLHYGIHLFALSGSSAFFGVFLLKSGVSAPGVLVAIALILLGRFLIRPGVLVLARRFGLKPVLIAGIVVTSLQYPLLAEVQGIGPDLFLLCAIAAIGETFYWTTYHAYFAFLGDAEHRGHQVGAREAAVSIVGVIGPLATGWALTAFGPRVAFGAAAVVMLSGALPILSTPNVAIPLRAPGALKAAMPGVLLFAADGVFIGGYFTVWQIALFRSLDESFSSFGGAMALAALFAAVGGLVLGRSIDFGHGVRAVWIALVVMTSTAAFRAVSYGSAPLAVLANASGALVACLYVPLLGTSIYNQAKRSACSLRFHIAAEAGWDLGGAGVLLVAAGLLAAGVPIGVCILLSLFGAFAAFYLLRGYFAALAPAG